MQVFPGRVRRSAASGSLRTESPSACGHWVLALGSLSCWCVLVAAAEQQKPAAAGHPGALAEHGHEHSARHLVRRSSRAVGNAAGTRRWYRPSSHDEADGPLPVTAGALPSPDPSPLSARSLDQLAEPRIEDADDVPKGRLLQGLNSVLQDETRLAVLEDPDIGLLDRSAAPSSASVPRSLLEAAAEDEADREDERLLLRFQNLLGDSRHLITRRSSSGCCNAVKADGTVWSDGAGRSCGSFGPGNPYECTEAAKESCCYCSLGKKQDAGCG
eukprot:TRINITY_DN123615_c0_g1_i1.p1 TRINITY_DN123615_c0_g1~~TRINITY_DN123615_c0_g1_i1.p1  ORF type:complete len:272 (-),score=33.48 TRINITY_DN123615_c0_g1_i1:71-886(-)